MSKMVSKRIGVPLAVAMKKPCAEAGLWNR
jgi:hypothetical protein